MLIQMNRSRVGIINVYENHSPSNHAVTLLMKCLEELGIIRDKRRASSEITHCPRDVTQTGQRTQMGARGSEVQFFRPDRYLIKKAAQFLSAAFSFNVQ